MHMKYCVAQWPAFTNLPRGSIGRLQDVVARGTLVAKCAFARRLNAVAGSPQDFCTDFDDRYRSSRLIIADDHPLFRGALRQAVSSVLPTTTVDEAGTFEDLTKLLEQDSDVDLILLDLSMPGISGFSGLIYLRAQYPAIPVVIVSASDDVGTIRQSLDFGASGFIPKRFGVDSAARCHRARDGWRRLGSTGRRYVRRQPIRK